MTKYSPKELKLFKILDLIGLVFVAIATLNNFFDGVDHEPFTSSILYPFTNYLVPLANTICLISTILYLLIPTQIWFIFFLFILETVNLMLTGFQSIGIIIYVNAFAFFCASGNAKTYFKQKAIIAGLFLFILMIPTYFTNGIYDFLYYNVFAAFLTSCFAILYFMLQDKLKYLFADINVPDLKPEIELPPTGSVLSLKSLGLTKRQIACINYTLNTSYNYKKIADELITSESTVKKDMQDLYKLFGVKNREMLRLLLVQYNID